ncbi:MAG: hypothetical protein INR69_10280 [Mucilaginibacter polytrichastri]|nr:hypothetical protein [Mucilaginibacter polytrichastri]
MITNIQFTADAMKLVLSNQRVCIVPLISFPEIAALTAEERTDFEVIDSEHLSFLALDEVYHLHDLIGL